MTFLAGSYHTSYDPGTTIKYGLLRQIGGTEDPSNRKTPGRLIRKGFMNLNIFIVDH